MRAGQIGSAGPRVIAAAIAVLPARVRGQPAQYHQVVAIRRERARDPRQLAERGRAEARRPASTPPSRCRSARRGRPCDCGASDFLIGLRRKRGIHRIEKRKRNGRAHAHAVPSDERVASLISSSPLLSSGPHAERTAVHDAVDERTRTCSLSRAQSRAIWSTTGLSARSSPRPRRVGHQLLGEISGEGRRIGPQNLLQRLCAPLNDRPSGSVPVASMSKLPSFSRQAPAAS